jgi:hypothetical protein
MNPEWVSPLLQLRFEWQVGQELVLYRFRFIAPEIQEAKIDFERFKESIDSDLPDDVKLYL